MKSISLRKLVLVVLWAASLLLVAQWGHSQTTKTLPLPGTIISGDEIGFRLQSLNGTPDAPVRVTGQWVVKINGNWAPVQAPGVTVKPLTEK